MMAATLGATAAVVSVIDVLLAQSIPAHEPDRLFAVSAGRARTQSGRDPLSFPQYQAYAAVSAFSQLAARSLPRPADVERDGNLPSSVSTTLVTDNFFDVLGLPAAIGRLAPRNGDVLHVVVSHRLWQRMSGDEHIVGSQIRVNGVLCTVVGVTSRSMLSVDGGLPVDVYAPLAAVDRLIPALTVRGTSPLRDGSRRWVYALGRLDIGSHLAQAQLQLQQIAEVQNREVADRSAWSWPFVESWLAFHDRELGQSKATSRTLLATAVVIVLMACANLAGVLLLRAEERRHEFWVRLALGASRLRVAAQLIIEVGLLTAVGAIVGIMMAPWMTSVVLATLTNDLSTVSQAAVGPLAILLTLIMAVGMVLMAGIIPAMRLPPLHDVASRTANTLGRRHVRARTILVTVQIALSAALTLVAGLLTRSVLEATRQPMGFDVRQTVEASLDLARHGYSDTTGRLFFEALLERIREVPGVRAAALTTLSPLGTSVAVTTLAPASTPHTSVSEPMVALRTIVSPGFFSALGVPVLAGRDFNDDDIEHAPLVAIINEPLARRLRSADGTNPQTMQLEGVAQPVAVIGVVADFRMAVRQTASMPAVYFPLRQQYVAAMTVVARVDGVPTAALHHIVNAVIRPMDPRLLVRAPRTLTDKMRERLSRERALQTLFVVSGLLALLLSAAALYGTVVFVTVQRTREFSLRLSLGAPPQHVVRLVLRQAMLLVLPGLVVGSIAGMIISRVMQKYLFGVTPYDLSTLAGIASLFIVLALVAAIVPGRRAALADPWPTLREL